MRKEARPDEVVYGMITALLHIQGIPEDPLEPEEFEDLLERCTTPGTHGYWRSLTDDQLSPLRDLIPMLNTLPAGENVVHVALISKSLVPEPNQGQVISTQPSAFATVRFFPDLAEWRVERLGDLGPPQPDQAN